MPVQPQSRPTAASVSPLRQPASAAEASGRGLRSLLKTFAGALGARTPPTGRELIVALALLLALAVAVLGRHVLDGGFYYDDWTTEGLVRSAPEPGLLGAVDGLIDSKVFIGRPVLMVVLATAHELFGFHTGLHLATALGLAVLMATTFYLALRTLRFERLSAGAIAALTLVFPWADATRLWPTAGFLNLALVFYLVGLVLALHGVSARGRATLAWHAGAVACYALSVLIYEATAPVIVLGAALYASEASWRAAVWRWAADLAVVAGSLFFLVAGGGRREVYSAGESVDHAEQIARQAVTLAGRAILPIGGVSTALALVGVLALAGLGLAAAWRREGGFPPSGRRWLTVAGAAVLGIGAAYAMYAPGNPWYLPLQPGHGTRVNEVAALGFVLLIFAFVMLMVEVLPQPWVRAGAAAALLAAIGVGYVVRLADDAAAWDRAYAAQGEVLGRMQQALPSPPRDSALLVYGHEGSTAPNVPVFVGGADLGGAAQVLYEAPQLTAFPVYLGATLMCTAQAVIVDSIYEGRFVAPYRRAVLVDVGATRAQAVRSPAQCRAASARLRLARG